MKKADNRARLINQLSPQHSEFIVSTKDDYTGVPYEAVFSSKFDSGNLHSQNLPEHKPNHFIFYPYPDCDRVGNAANNCTWFYFRVTGLPNGMNLTFEARKMRILHRLYKLGSDTFRPVIKIGTNGKWTKIKERAVQDYTDNKELYAIFPITIDFDNNENYLEIAFSFPYPYSEMMDDIENMNFHNESIEPLYFHREIMTRSCEGQDIPLMTITSHDGKLDAWETYQLIEGTSKCRRFDSRKPVILLSSRVHPGEVPCSHALNGAIKFLLDKNHPDAAQLRKAFVFKIYPCVNPDGVYYGHIRKDRYLQNLNRFYKRPTPQKQPACYYLKLLLEYLAADHRLMFFGDFHAHSGQKNAFVYGNFCNFARQVESRLFCKIQDNQGPEFTYTDCDFSIYHMKAKEKGDECGKEACARVLGYHNASLAHSYTFELSYHSILDATTKSEIKPFELEDIERVGKNFILSLLYNFNLKRTYRDYKTNKNVLVDLKSMREEIARDIKQHFVQDENRLEAKCKDINNLVLNEYYLRNFHNQMEYLKAVRECNILSDRKTITESKHVNLHTGASKREHNNQPTKQRVFVRENDNIDSNFIRFCDNKKLSQHNEPVNSLAQKAAQSQVNAIKNVKEKEPREDSASQVINLNKDKCPGSEKELKSSSCNINQNTIDSTAGNTPFVNEQNAQNAQKTLPMHSRPLNFYIGKNKSKEFEMMFNNLNSGVNGAFPQNVSMNLLNLNEAEHKYIIENYGLKNEVFHNLNNIQNGGNIQNVDKNTRKDKFVNNIKKKLAQKNTNLSMGSNFNIFNDSNLRNLLHLIAQSNQPIKSDYSKYVENQLLMSELRKFNFNKLSNCDKANLPKQSDAITNFIKGKIKNNQQNKSANKNNVTNVEKNYGLNKRSSNEQYNYSQNNILVANVKCQKDIAFMNKQIEEMNKFKQDRQKNDKEYANFCKSIIANKINSDKDIISDLNIENVGSTRIYTTNNTTMPDNNQIQLDEKFGRNSMNLLESDQTLHSPVDFEKYYRLTETDKDFYKSGKMSVNDDINEIKKSKTPVNGSKSANPSRSHQDFELNKNKDPCIMLPLINIPDKIAESFLMQSNNHNNSFTKNMSPDINQNNRVNSYEPIVQQRVQSNVSNFSTKNDNFIAIQHYNHGNNTMPVQLTSNNIAVDRMRQEQSEKLYDKNQFKQQSSKREISSGKRNNNITGHPRTIIMQSEINHALQPNIQNMYSVYKKKPNLINITGVNDKEFIASGTIYSSSINSNKEKEISKQGKPIKANVSMQMNNINGLNNNQAPSSFNKSNKHNSSNNCSSNKFIIKDVGTGLKSGSKQKSKKRNQIAQVI